jgi:hypothetical protein
MLLMTRMKGSGVNLTLLAANQNSSGNAASKAKSRKTAALEGFVEPPVRENITIGRVIPRYFLRQGRVTPALLAGPCGA